MANLSEHAGNREEFRRRPRNRAGAYTQQANCNVCSVQFVQKTACFFDTAQQLWREDGVYRYKCLYNF
jgi:hypothetical protein